MSNNKKGTKPYKIKVSFWESSKTSREGFMKVVFENNQVALLSREDVLSLVDDMREVYKEIKVKEEEK